MCIRDRLNVDEHNRVATTDGRLIRRMARDYRTRGASAKRTLSMWESVKMCIRDRAGVKAALRAIPILKEAGLSTRVINMRPYKDPDEFIKALGCLLYTSMILESC